MNRFNKMAGAIRPVTGRISGETSHNLARKTNRNQHSFKEMISWRKEQGKKERLDRNKVKLLDPYDEYL